MAMVLADSASPFAVRFVAWLFAAVNFSTLFRKKRYISSLHSQDEANGEVTEWLKVHAWNACVRQRTVGSNPTFSAISLYRSAVRIS